MGSPPPPPAHHGYGYASPHDVHSQFSGNSGRYSDEYGQYSENHYADRRASQAPSVRTTSSSNSNSNKTYVYYQVQRGEGSWAGCRRYEISAPQDEIKRKAKSKSKSGDVSGQLQKMGKPRQDLIESLRAGLDALETDGSSWETVFIETTKTKARGNTPKVVEFNIIFRRRSPRPEASRHQPTGGEGSFVQQGPAQTPMFTTHPIPATAGANKGVNEPKDEYLQSPFAKTLFSPHGQPMNANGPIPFAASMPGNIPPERTMAQMLPRVPVQPALAPAAAPARNSGARTSQGNLVDLDAILGKPSAGDPDGVINVGEEHTSHHTRLSPRPRRQSSAQRPNHGGRHSHVNIETRHPESYTSSRSSWASEQGSVLYGELDELSSKASGDSYSSRRSPPRETHRTSNHARHTSGQHSPGSPKYRSGDAMVVTERTRRPTPVYKQNHLFGAVEQTSPKRSSSKPMVFQPTPPRPSAIQPAQAIPPTAEYPSYYTEKDREHRVDDYIYEMQREQERRKAGEADLAQREREVERQVREREAERERHERERHERESERRRRDDDRKASASRPAILPAGGRGRYNYEPRDIYGH